MGKALYRKYRSKKLSEIIGQEHITTTLSNALKSNQLSHAYLFTGPRGVGKTSVARILAHEVNNLPYEDDNTHLDIIEIDAASNRRIDEIRQLREKINLAPTSAKYKVYIIDEVHMLTREAFNALLKTLEEPPEHVIFILATTEAYKVPETIISRTQQFNFRPISASQMTIQLKKIAKAEKIDADDDALMLIAEYGEGSFRDSLSLLDQLSSSGSKVTSKELYDAMGTAPAERIDHIIKALEDRSSEQIVKQLNDIYDQGYSVGAISKQLLLRLRESLVTKDISLEDKTKLVLIKQLIEVPASSDPDTLLEIILLSYATSSNDQTPRPTATVLSEVITENPVKSKASPGPTKTSKTTTVKFDETIWPNVISSIKNQHNTLYGIARMVVPSVDSGELVLKTKFEFHERALNDIKNQKIISDIIEESTGEKVILKIVVDKELVLDTPSEDNSEEVGSLSSINNIFGSAEVIE
jgi:DNA polymerase-3 subunit gamma/tau